MEFLLGLVFFVVVCVYLGCRLVARVFVWVCEPMIQYVEAKEVRSSQFMDTVVEFIKEQEENMQNLSSTLLTAEENYQAQESLLKDLEGSKLSALSAANQARAANLEKRQALSQLIQALEEKIAQTDLEITQARATRRQAKAASSKKEKHAEEHTERTRRWPREFLDSDMN